MTEQRQKALAEFRRVMVWVVAAAVVMVFGALAYLRSSGELTVAMVLATIFGVFVSVLLGGGLMAAIFFSDKSGLDQDITDATKRNTRDDGKEDGKPD